MPFIAKPKTLAPTANDPNMLTSENRAGTAAATAATRVPRDATKVPIPATRVLSIGPTTNPARTRPLNLSAACSAAGLKVFRPSVSRVKMFAPLESFHPWVKELPMLRPAARAIVPLTPCREFLISRGTLVVIARIIIWASPTIAIICLT